MRTIQLKRGKGPKSLYTYDGPLIPKDKIVININDTNYKMHERVFTEVNLLIKKLRDEQSIVSIELLDYMRRKGIKKIGSQTRVESTTIEWDMNGVRDFIKKKSVRTKARKANIDLSKIIITSESVNRLIMEELLKAGIIRRKDVKKIMDTYPRGGYLRQARS